MVTSWKPVTFTDIIVQGRGDQPAWVKSFHVEYSIDGMNWVQYQYGQNFEANNDQHTKKFIELDPPIHARAVKIIVDSFYIQAAMRFGLLFLEGSDEN